MTTSTFTPPTNAALDVDWSDPTIWSGGTVPVGTDVVIPAINEPQQGVGNPTRSRSTPARAS